MCLHNVLLLLRKLARSCEAVKIAMTTPQQTGVATQCWTAYEPANVYVRHRRAHARP